MGWVTALLRREPKAPRFFGAYAQSSVGTGAGYVAVVLVAYERYHSPLAISLVLLADIAPPMVLGPLFGAAVDRWSRKWSAISADVVRALAFTGIALTHSFALTFLLALVAGAGTALWKPAVMAALPGVVSRERLPAATALYSALTEIGYTVGPGIAALVLLFSGSTVLLAANAASFGLSALLLSTLRFGSRLAPASHEVQHASSLLREARHGIGVAVRTPAVRIVIAATSSILFFGGLVNVAELLLTNQLGGGKTGYALLVTVSGVAVAIGAIVGKSGGALSVLQRRFLTGICIFALGYVAASASPAFAGLVAGVGLAGLGNGMVIVFQRLILQRSVEEELLGRIFGVQVALDGAAFTSSYLIAAGLLQLTDPRALFIVAVAGATVVALVTAAVLRSAWDGEAAPSAEPAEEPAAEELLAALGSSELR